MSVAPRELPLRLYRALLRLLPAELRDACGEEIEAAFGDELAAARRRGPLAAAAATAAAACDVIRRAPYEHWRRRRHTHTKERSVLSFVADLRFAARSFARQKGATALVLLTLTLAVAANTAVFALIDGVFFRPFPFPDPERLVYLNERAPKWNLEYTGISFADYRAWRGRARAFEGMGLMDDASVNLADGEVTERIDGARVTHDLAATLGIRPLLGRTFTPEEDRPKAPPVVILSYGLWKSRFAGSPDVVGRSIRLNSEPTTVVGVLPEGQEFPAGVQLWIPLAADSADQVGSYGPGGVGRLKPGVTLEAARADLLEAHRSVWRERDTAQVVTPRVEPLRERFAGDFKVMGKALGAGVALVLLIACANVAGAMLARAIFRQREVGIRMALGASAGRIERQLLTESLLLAVVAGLAGSLLGWWGLSAFVAALGEQFPPWVDVGVSPRTAAFAVAIVLVTTLLFGLVPALQVRRQDVRFALAASPSRSTTASAGQRRMLHGLVVVEIALAAVLLAAGGLLFRAYANLRDVDPGFRVDGIAGFRLSLPEAKYGNGLEQRQLHERLAERLATLPGVEGVGVISCPPLTCHWGSFFAGEGVIRPPDAADPVTLIRVATPEYFRTMDIPLLRGRVFRRDEWTRGPAGFRAVMVNESFAKHMWPGVADPTGRRVRYARDTAQRWMTVVGVTKDDRHYGLAQPMRPGIFFPITQIDTGNSLRTAGFVVRTSLDPASVIPALRAAVREVDPELPLFEAGPMRRTIERSLATRRILATSLATFAAIALTLAIGGIYAVLSYVVGRRRHEIGIRVALGAQRRDVLGLIVRQGLGLVAAGLVIGIPLALAASRALASLLVGVGPRDPLTYGIVALLLALTGLAAALVPAWRAARVEPTVALAEGG